MKIMFEITKEVEDQKNDFNNKYSRLENKSQREFVRNQINQSDQENQNKQTIKLDQEHNKLSKDVKLLTSEHSNNRFESVSVKSIE